MSGQFCFPSTGIHAPQATLLAIDDVSLPLRTNLCYYLSKPTVRPQPLLTPRRDDPTAPDDAVTFFYGAVIHEDGPDWPGRPFRMWYYAAHWGESTGEMWSELKEGPVCYAESADGIEWIRPSLGQVSFRGSRDNNIIALPDFHTEGVHVIKDGDDPDPDRRYKMVYNYRPANRNFWTIRTAASPDGLQWTAGPELPFDGFIEQASLYKHNGLYWVNGQMHSRSEGGHRAGRQAFTIVSPDFDHWLPEQGESFLMPEPANPVARGLDKPYDQAHIGVGATSFGNVLVGLYCIWHNVPYPTPEDWFGMGTTSGDFGLLISNDGQHFREPVKGHVWLHRNESPMTPIPNAQYETIMTQGNGILNVGDQTLIYHGRWGNSVNVTDYYSEIALATLPRDRWGALGLFPDQVEGSVWSCPVTLPAGGGQFVLNADRACDMRVEIADEKYNLLPAYSGEQSSATQIEGGLDCPVAWPVGSLAALAGQTVRLRVQVKRQAASEPRLYAVVLQ